MPPTPSLGVLTHLTAVVEDWRPIRPDLDFNAQLLIERPQLFNLRLVNAKRVGYHLPLEVSGAEDWFLSILLCEINGRRVLGGQIEDTLYAVASSLIFFWRAFTCLPIGSSPFTSHCSSSSGAGNPSMNFLISTFTLS